jgi:hypothetical protein
MSLLTVLVEKHGLRDVFRAWPPNQGNQIGDAGYWKDLSQHLLECLVTSRARVWPIIAPRNATAYSYDYVDLQSALVAGQDEQELDVLQVLATFGLKITRPPVFIYKLLKDENSVKLLTPQTAHAILQVGSLHDT